MLSLLMTAPALLFGLATKFWTKTEVDHDLFQIAIITNSEGYPIGEHLSIEN